MGEISVIIPNYNHEKYLKKRIDSILHQSHKILELIILDDCSVDNSCEIINQYKGNPKVQIYKNKINSGSTFEQWVKGVNLASGDLIWIAESDDYADPHLLNELMIPILKNEDVVLSYCNHHTINEESDLIENQHFFSSSFDGSIFNNAFIMDGKEFIEKFLIHKNVIPNASGVLFKKSIFKKTIAVPRSAHKMGDWLYWLQMLSFGKVAYSPNKYNYFRNYPTETYNYKKIGSLSATYYGYEMRVIYAEILKGHQHMPSNKICKINNTYISCDIGNMGIYDLKSGNYFKALRSILIAGFWPNFKIYFIANAIKIIFKR